MSLVPEISLIIPVWDRLDCTSRFVTQCLRDTVGDLEVIVVDNGSTDGTLEWLRTTGADLSVTHQKGLAWIHNEKNEGYSKGLNQGLMLARGEYLACLNNDIVIGKKSWLEQLVAPLKQNKRILLGARMIHDNHQVRIDGLWTPSYLEGWCHVFHRDFLDEVGFYDEAYTPAFVEDVDMCWRAVRHGYKLIQHPGFRWLDDGMMLEGLVYHIYGRTTYAPRAEGGHREDTRHWEITPPHVEIFRAKVRRGDDLPYYPEGWEHDLS